MTSKRLHRLTAIILGLFIVSHLAVHLTALGGIETHLATLDAIQWIYRNPIGEIILVAAILSQVITGFKRLKFKRRNKAFWARAQVISGLYLIMFLIVHTGAALYTHHIFGVETDFYWVAGSLHFSPIKYVFAVYYFLAVLSIFVHFAAAVHFGWRSEKKPILRNALPLIGLLIAGTIIFTFWGGLYSIQIPDDVTAYYQKYFGLP